MSLGTQKFTCCHVRQIAVFTQSLVYYTYYIGTTRTEGNGDTPHKDS